MKAPFFTLPHIIKQDEINLNEYQGKVLLLTFWVSWCPDSQRDLELKEQLYKRMDTDQFKMLMINVTGREAVSENGIRFYKDKGFTFPCLKDNGTKTYDLFQCMSVPTTFLINRNGSIVQRYNDKASFQEIIKGISQVI